MAGETRRNPNRHAHAEYRDAVDVSRFWSLVNKGGEDECWHWQGDVDRDGYGVFVFHGRKAGAHEYALSFTTGEKRGHRLDTRHSCDNPPCVNPKHLSFGTRKENVGDMLERGRGPRGGRLSDSQIIEIRERRKAGARQIDLAKQYGISDGQVSMIVRGLRWADVGGPIEAKQSQYRKESA